MEIFQSIQKHLQVNMKFVMKSVKPGGPLALVIRNSEWTVTNSILNLLKSFCQVQVQILCFYRSRQALKLQTNIQTVGFN
uniref:Uncharacterized protein n=1 Tax=Oryza barthii TaxID=65489 RepID=A0A0D3GM62_9ORYZ